MGLSQVVFHSYRHTWRSRMYKAPTEMAQRLGGWTISGVSEKYGENNQIAEFRNWIEQVNYSEQF